MFYNKNLNVGKHIITVTGDQFYFFVNNFDLVSGSTYVEAKLENGNEVKKRE